MKKLLAALLAVVMTVQLAVPAWAVEGEDTGDTAAYTEPSETPVPEPTEEPAAESTAQPSAEPTAEPTQEPTAEPTAEPTEEPQAQAVRVRFVCTPEELTLAVYPAEGDVDQLILPEEDGSYLLAPGTYAYLAAAEGYETAEGSFTVEENAEEQSVEIVLTAAAGKPAAEDEPALLASGSGTCGNNLTWTLTSDGTLTISGTGDMANYDPKNQYEIKLPSWYEYRSAIKAIVIQSGATSIGDYAFSVCRALTSITIPASVTSIGDYAFSSCSNLTSITIPDSVTSIGDYAFYNCSSLTSITLSNSVTSIGDYAFEGCSSLTSITIPDGVTSIGKYAFSDCSALTSITLPNSVTSIGSFAFSGCRSLTSITIPEGVTSIWGYTFSGCCSLTSVTIPKSVTNIEAYAFHNCSSSTSVYISDIAAWCKISFGSNFGTGFSSYDSNPLGGNLYLNGELVTDLVVPNGIKSIEDSAFSCCRSLTSVTIPKSVTSIGRYAFSGCSSLSSITIPDSVTSIGSYAFRGCSSLTSVTIPDSVTGIGSYAFSGCRSLTSITIPEGVTSIGDYTFSGCSSLTSISIPDGVTSIGREAFSHCSALTSIAIPANVTSIGYYAFDGCSSLEAITVAWKNFPVYHSAGNCIIQTAEKTLIAGCKNSVIPTDGSVTSIGVGAFSGCTGLTSITIPVGVMSIGYAAFSGCTGLTSITIPDSMTSIEERAFVNCSSLTSITIPVNVTNIDVNAFGDCTGLTEITVLSGTTKCDKEAFSGCDKLKKIRYKGWEREYSSSFSYALPDAVVEYLPVANGSCGDALTWVLTGDGVLTISGAGSMTDYTVGSAPWNGMCSEIKSVAIESGVTNIGNFAFSDCTKLMSMTVPANIISIGASAFANCTSLTEITVDSSATTCAENAFSDCTHLKSARYLGWESEWASSGFAAALPNVAVTYLSMADGSCGEALTWAMTGDSVLTISGSGSMADYVDDSAPWSAYSEKIKTVVIESGATSIGKAAFKDCAALASISIPKSVAAIGDSAFSGCTSLTSITIPASVTSIGGSAFSGCTALTDITLPANITSIANGTFKNCSVLENITIPETVTAIGDSAFSGCVALSSVTFPASITNIGATSFEDCTGLNEITVGSGATKCAKNAFSGCSNLTNVRYPGREDEWTSSGFEAALPNAIVEYLPVSDGSCGADLVWVLTSNGTLTISGTGDMVDYTYSSGAPWSSLCSNIKTVVIESGVTSIGDRTFYGCSSLTNITIPEGVTSIGWYAFSGCNALTSITIPSSVTSIGNSAFNTCSSLTSIEIPDRVTSIGEKSFCDCSNLVSISLPESITSIGNSAFKGCSSLISITIPANVTSVGTSVFFGCSSLTSITIPDGMTTIGTAAFERCSSLTGINLPETVTSIGSRAFYGCSSLTSIRIPATVTKIESTVFSRCTSLKNVTVPDSVTSIGSSAFSGCSSLTSVTIPDGVTSVGSYAFSNCSSLTNITIPDSLLIINNSVFADCSSLISVRIPDGVTNIDDSAFSGCVALRDISLPTSITSIGTDVFKDCSALASITIPAGMTSIGASAFSGCTGLTEITVLSSTTKCSEDAFSGCTNLKSVRYLGRESEWISSGFAAALPDVTIDFHGSCGESLTWELTGEGELTISGTGNMADYDYANVPWYEMRSQIKTVVIKSGVTSIGNYAFYDCSSLTNVTIPEGVTSIGAKAFSGCNELTSITIPVGVTSIGDSVFSNCSNLTSITIPESVTSIGSYAFSGCSRLKSITLPASVTSIGSNAFYGCSALQDASYAGTIEQWVSVSVGSNNTKLTDALTVDGVHYLGYGYCRTGLHWYLAPDGVLTIYGNGAMDDFVDYGSHPDWSLQTAPWVEYRSSITSVVIREGVTKIGENAFSSCYDNLTSVTIPASVANIGYHAFYRCRNLVNLSISEGVTSIGNSTFEDCTSLKSVTIPASVTSIGEDAFYGCSLTEITFGHKKSMPLTISSHAFSYYGNSTVVVRVPSKLHINPAITGYSWGYSTYESTGNYPLQGIALATKDGASEYELGLPVELVVTLDPEDTTENFAVEIVPEKTTAEARVSKDGVITTYSVGTVTVRAYCMENPAVNCELTVTVTQPTGAFESFSITTFNDYPGEAEVGKDVRMMPTFTPLNAAERTLTWSVENGTGTATIDENGVLTPLTTGTITVYATAVNGTEASCTVNIVRYVEDITIFVNGKTDVDRLGVNESMELSAVITPEDATVQDVTWSVKDSDGRATIEYHRSNNYSDVYVYSLRGVSAGTVTLIATANDSKKVVAEKEMTITDTVRSYALPDGSGKIYYNAETGVITGSDSSVRDVLIPAQIDGVTITGIAQYAFARLDSWKYVNDNTTLTSVSIPNTVTEIGKYAFSRCTAMSTLRFAPGSQLRTIGEGAFSNCSGFTSLTLPDGVQTVGEDAFAECSGIVTLVIPDSVQTVGEDSFSFNGERGTLKNVTMPGELIVKVGRGSIDSLTLTGTCVRYAGEENWLPQRSAKRVTLSEGITRIEAGAFMYLSSIKELQFPSSLQTIEENAFSECNGLTTVNLPDSLQSIGKNAFSYCDSLEYFDLSAIPDVITAKETPLKDAAAVPPVLVRATGGKVQLRWSIGSVDDGNPWEIAELMSDSGGGSSASGNNCRLYAISAGKVRLIYEDDYTGLCGSKIIEIKAGNAIRPSDTAYLVSGKKVTLSLWAVLDDKKLTASWSLAPGDEAYASLTSGGVLTAKDVTGAHQITITAVPSNGSETVIKTLWIIPKTTGVELTLDDEAVTGTLPVDMYSQPALQLAAQTYPADAADDVTWTSSAPKIASVDENGTVTFLKPGKTVIKATAQDGTAKYAQITLNVTYLDASSKVTLTADVPSFGLQPGQSVPLTLVGTDAIPAENVEFSIPEKQAAIGSVDENGVFTAGTTAGTVTVTAAVKNDPLNRKATRSIKVIPMQATGLMLTADIPEELLTFFGSEPMAVLDRADITQNMPITLTATATDYTGGSIALPKLKWASKDTSIATVNAQGVVTVKKGASGTVAIEATVQDLNKTVGRFWVQVRDYSPRLAAATLTLNTALAAGVSTGLVESFGNTVTGVTLSDERFAAAYENGVLTVTVNDHAQKAGTYKMTLTAVCANGISYPYTVTVKVTRTFPGVTVKQTGKFNLFYTDSESHLTITVPNQTVTGFELIDTDFVLSPDGTLTYADPENVPAKPDTKGTLLIYLEGYALPITRAYTVSAVNTAPGLKLSAAGSTVNTALGQLKTTVQLLDKKTGAVQELAGLHVWTDTANAAVDTNGSDIVLTPTAGKTVAANVYVQGDTWTKAVKLSHRVNVTATLPTLKPAVSTLKLSTIFTARTAETTLVLSQSNAWLTDVEVTPVAKEGTAARTEAGKLDVAYDMARGTVTACIRDANDLPKAGTYSFTIRGELPNGKIISGGTLKVTVAATVPAVTFSATSAKLNRYLAGDETANITVTLKNGTGYTVTGFEGLPEGMEYYNEGLHVTLPNDSSTGGTYKLYATVRDDTTGQEVTLPKAISFKITTYSSAKLTPSLSASGKLDTLNPDSAIIYTVNKINNCLNTVEGVALAGADGDKFHAELDTTGAKPVIRLTMLDGQQYATNVTYKVQFNLSVCGQDVLSPVMSIRVTQSALKLKTTAAVTLYQSQTKRLENTVTITSPLTAAIADVQLNTAKTPALFFDAIGGENGFAAVINGNTADLSFTTGASAKLRAGSSYKVVLDVTPANCAANVKPTQITITVKVMK